MRDGDRGRFRTLQDLAGRKVATLGGTLAWELLTEAQGRHGIEPVSYDDDVHPYSDLAIGRVDAVLLDHVIAERGMRRQPGLFTHPDAVAVGYYVALLAPEQTALRDQVNEALRAAMADGRLEAHLPRVGRSGTTTSASSTRGCSAAPRRCSAKGRVRRRPRRRRAGS